MIDKWQKRMEKVTANAVFRALQKQKRDFQQYLRNNGIPDDGMLKVILNRSDNAVVDGFISRVKTTINRSYTDTGKKGPKQPDGLDFSLPTRPESIYLHSLRDLHLSQRKGSISATTEERVKKLVTSGIKKGQSAKEIANNIEKLDSQVFSKNRADLIAINQIGKAKQFGEFTAMKEFHDAGYVVLKYWSTVNDSRVTRTHTANQGDGWIFHDKTFSGTGDLIPPASDNPRCRCACLYKVGNLKGTKQPQDIQNIFLIQEHKKEVGEYFEKLENLYDYSKDILMQNAMTDWQGSNAEYFRTLWNNQVTEEEAVALYWWKSERYEDINKSFRNREINGKYSGMVKYLRDGVNSLPRYNKVVWQGVPDKDFNTLERLENLTKGDIFNATEFFPTSKKKSKALEFGNTLIQINNPKTGGDFGKPDELTLQEYEVLFNPNLSLEFVKRVGNTFIFNEI